MLRIPCEKVTPLVYSTIPVIISLPCPKSKNPKKTIEQSVESVQS